MLKSWPLNTRVTVTLTPEAASGIAELSWFQRAMHCHHPSYTVLEPLTSMGARAIKAGSPRAEFSRSAESRAQCIGVKMHKKCRCMGAQVCRCAPTPEREPSCLAYHRLLSFYSSPDFNPESRHCSSRKRACGPQPVRS